MGESSRVASAWEAEYRTGRYVHEPPVPFVEDILAAARARSLVRGLYIGCGNGRNFVPLVEGGLDLDGLDLSGTAIQQLAERLPSHRDRLHVGDVSLLPGGASYPLVIGIQVFQHGNRDTTHRHLRAAQELVRRGGLFCLRVNAVGTEYEHRSELVESDADGSETIRYLEGPKVGLQIHFFSRAEVEGLFARDFTSALALSLRTVTREPPERGRWCQWEGIWEKV